MEKKILSQKQEVESGELHHVLEIGISMFNGLFRADQSIFVS